LLAQRGRPMLCLAPGVIVIRTGEGLIVLLSALRPRSAPACALASAYAFALACAFALALFTVAPAFAGGPVRLSGGSVSPASGPTSTVFAFRVTYTSSTDTAPGGVWLVLDGGARRMAPVDPSDTDYRDGAVFSYGTTLGNGSHTYAFRAQDEKTHAQKVVATLAGGTVTVGTSDGGDPGGSSGNGTSDSGAGPGGGLTGSTGVGGDGGTGSDSTGTGTSGTGTSGTDSDSTGATDFARGTSSATGSGTGSDSAGSTGDTAGAPAGDAAAAQGGDGSSGATPAGDSPSSGPDGSSGPGASDSSAGSGRATDGRQGRGLDRDPEAVLPGLDDRTLPLTTLIVSTASSVLVAMALFSFGRRRDAREDPPDRSAEPHAWDGPADPVAPHPSEASLPRWRRPSLLAARRATPGTVSENGRLTFGSGRVAPDPEHERRRIRYRLVRITHIPDEIAGQEIGRLDQGDEVELLERSGLFWRVRCPDGAEGWIHKMTLGDRVEEEPECGPAWASPLGGLGGVAPLAEEPGLAAQFLSRRGA